MDISVVVPLYNEAESLPELAEWIERVMKENNFTYEVLMINDGSTDNSWEVVKELHEKNENQGRELPPQLRQVACPQYWF